ncbi:uncharacterized protein LOC113748956 isoform X2 [Coffea eugenioides]|uniref:uncharacterized protein LOC113748956 isoform X2 n=1 Tax=Coffea eugenioides TaxID=49369 RepID=UPI000F60A22E|nr:uncharacterized protein LOC113748956 isoform X2 [Coffea eugenioides]
MKAETLTLILVNLAGIMERADESLLPGVYKEVGEALHTGPTGLGVLTLFRSMVQSLCYPLATYLAVRHNRAHVIAYGAFLWAAATLLVAFSSTYFEVAVSRALNGIGLAIVAPAIQSLVADSTDDSHRGIPGWRISFHLVAFISVVVGLLVRLFARDPHFPDGSARAVSKVPKKPFMSEVKDLVQEAKNVIGIQSFRIIVAQGVTGSFPWSALSFAAMWLELTGFSHAKTAFLMGLFVVANSLGGLFGGMMGDVLSRRLPNSGRIILSQTSSASAIPLAAVLLLGLPDNPSTIFLHALVLSITGFCISWNAPATNNPIFAEIVPEKSRTSIYALDRSFESILSSFAPPVVGLLAQYIYGFKPVPEGSLQIATDRENATSLAKALYTTIGIPMALCCFIYSFLYRTYPRDRERAQMQALIESEMQLMELDTSRPRGVYGQVQSSDPKEHFLDDRTIIDMDYGEEEFDFDDSDEKTAIYRASKASSSGE